MRPALILCICLLAACVQGDQGFQSARVLITVEGLRADRLGILGTAPDPAPYLSGLASESRFHTQLRTASTAPLAALASALTGLPPDEHGVVAAKDPLRSQLPAEVVTLGEAQAEAGLVTLASVVGLSAESGLGRGCSEQHFGWKSNAEAVDFALERAREKAAGEREVFAWIHLVVPISSPPSPEAWGRFARHHLGPFAATDPELEARLAEGEFEGLESYLGRRRGTPAWTALRHARYEAALFDLDRDLGRLVDGFQEHGLENGGWLAILGTGGAPLTVSGAPPYRRFLAQRVDSLFLWRSSEASPARFDDPLSTWSVTERMWPGGVAAASLGPEWLPVRSSDPSEIAFVSAAATWVRHGEMEPVGFSREDRSVLAGSPPDELREALRPPRVSGRLIDRGTEPGEVRLTLRSALTPNRAKWAEGVDVNVAFVFPNPDVPLRLGLRLPEGRTASDVFVLGRGRLDGLGLPLVATGGGDVWEAEDAPWKVDVTRAAGGRYRVRVHSNQHARLHLFLAPNASASSRSRYDWEVQSHGSATASYALGPGEVLVEGASLDVSVVTAGKPPAIRIEIAGDDLVAGDIRWLGKRFAGREYSFLLTPHFLASVPEGPSAPDASRFLLDLDLPPRPPLAEVKWLAPVTVPEVPGANR